MKSFFSITLFLFVTLSAQAQKVTSKSYGEMLFSLLSHSVPEIEVKTAAALKKTIFIDAREEVEFNVSHIKNAYWSGYDDFDMKRLTGVPKNIQIVVYCSVGYRSEKIAEKLIAAGFSKVWNLYGGIFEWKNQGYPVYDLSGLETEKVHAYDKSWGMWLTTGEKVY